MDDPLVPPATELLILSGAQCSDLLDLGDLREALAAALRAHSDGESNVPPRIAARVGSGFLGAMPGNVNGVGLAAKLVSVFPDNHGTDVPSHQGLIALFDQDDGRPLAVMDGAYITAIRTAASAALAADLASRASASKLAIIGAGVQGHAHARTFADIRDWTEIRIASRTRANADTLAAAAGPHADVAASFEAAVRGADVVALCTDAHDPVLDRAWLDAGVHVSSVGVGGEVDAATVGDADVVLVEWRGAADNPPPTGARELQGLDPATLVEVGEVVAGRAEARPDDDAITLYKSTGHAVEDVAAASIVYRRAVESGTGTRVTV